MNPAMDEARYRDQIARYARGLVGGVPDQLRRELAPGARLDQAAAFSRENAEKRFEKLFDRFAWMEEHFPELRGWLRNYVRETAIAAADNGDRDAGRFLDAIESRPLTEEQRDCVVLQRARSAVLQLARSRRAEHVRFQQLWEQTDPDADPRQDSRYWLNPIRVSATLRTRLLLGDDAATPAEILLFPVGSEIRTAILEPEAKTIIADFDEQSSWSWRELNETFTGDREDLSEACRAMLEMGLLACER